MGFSSKTNRRNRVSYASIQAGNSLIISLRRITRFVYTIGMVALLASCSSEQLVDRSYPPLWRVDDPSSGHQLWLYGTVHTLPDGKSPRIKFVQRRGSTRLPLPVGRPEWVSSKLDQVIRRVDSLVLELDYSRQPKSRDGLSAPIKSQINNHEVQNLTPLFSYLNEENKQFVIRAGAQRGLQTGDLEKLSAPSTLFMLSVLPRQDTGLNQLRGVEDWLLSYARIRKIPLAGLETPVLRLEAIASAMRNIAPEQQHQVVLDYLGSSIEEDESPLEGLEALYQMWRSGELGAFEKQRAAFAEFYPEIYEAFLGYRNRAWVPKIIEYINSGEDVLIAVGQGHLLGPENIRELLTDAGYQITRLQ